MTKPSPLGLDVACGGLQHPADSRPAARQNAQPEVADMIEMILIWIRYDQRKLDWSNDLFDQRTLSFHRKGQSGWQPSRWTSTVKRLGRIPAWQTPKVSHPPAQSVLLAHPEKCSKESIFWIHPNLGCNTQHGLGQSTVPWHYV